MASIPLDVIEDTLCRLPVKPLKRFRCVAKSWRFLMDSDRFVKSHLNMSLETNSRRHLILRARNDVFNVDLDSADPVNNAKASVIKQPFPNSVTRILNSCNGLFLVVGEQLIIWNPFTTEFKYLPGIRDDDFPVASRCFSTTAYGFAYDSRNDDYKVVRVVTHRETLLRIFMATRAHIFSLKTNSWKLTAEKFTYPAVKHWHTHVNGALHTLLTEYRSPVDTGHTKTMTFSVESEKLHQVKLPSGLSDGRDVVKALHNIGGYLSLIYYASESGGTEIWVMKDYGVRKSWTKMLSLPFCVTLTELDNGAMKPLAHTRDGHKVMLYTDMAGYFVWHDFRNAADIQAVPVEGLPAKLDYIEGCVESLILLHGEKQVQRQGQLHAGQDKKQDNKKTRKKSDGFLSTGFKLKL